MISENNVFNKISATGKKYFLLFVILIATSLVYFKSTQNDFLIFDDSEMITDNKLVESSFSFQNTLNIFNLNNTVNEYQPLTALSYNLLYSVFGMNPFYFHAFAILLHLCNVLLVFVFLSLLFIDKKLVLLVTAFFALHPLNVEAVAWASATNYLLFSCFFLLSSIFYLKYYRNGFKPIFYIWALLFFLVALLSKSSAVVLPIVFLSIDYINNRKWNIGCLTDKVPFFIMAFVFGIIALYLKSEVLPEVHSEIFPFSDRIVFAFYALGMYVVKILFPFNLKLLYSYPVKIDGFFSEEYYLIPVLILLLFIILILYFKKYRRFILFSLLFSFVNIFLVIHIIPYFHVSIIAERYVYIAAIGIYLIFARLLLLGLEYLKTHVMFKYALPFMLVVILSLVSFSRVLVWQNDDAMFGDLLNKNEKTSLTYTIRGLSKAENGDENGALEDYAKALEIDSTYVKAYFNRAFLYAKRGDTELALQDYDMAIAYNPDFVDALLNRGQTKGLMNDMEGAMADYNKVIGLDPKNSNAYFNRGNVYVKTGALNEALGDYNKAIQIKPGFVDVYYNRGNTFFKLGNYDEAVANYSMAINENPKYVEAFNNRGAAQNMMGHSDDALLDFCKVLQINPLHSDALMNRAYTYLKKGEIKKACQDWKIAKTIGNQVAEKLMTENCMKIN